MNFILKRKLENEKKYKELLINNKDLYYIPDKYKDSKEAVQRKLNIKIKRNNKNLLDMIEDWNQMYDELQFEIPKDIGENLEKIFDDDQYDIGIHRTSLDESQINNWILKDGLKCDYEEINSTIQFFYYFPFFLREIKYCESYKMSDASIIFKIPKDIEKSELTYKIGNSKYIKPEYIVGYVMVKNKNMIKFIENELYIEKEKCR